MSVYVMVSEGTRRMAHNLDELLDRWNLRSNNDDSDHEYLKRFTTIRDIEPVIKKPSFISSSTVVSKLESMDYEDLHKLMLDVNTLNNEAKLQIRVFNVQAKGRKDFEWLREAEYIQKTYGDLHQFIQREMGNRARSKKEKTYDGYAFSSVFMDVAKEYLGDELFTKIKKMAFTRLAELSDEFAVKEAKWQEKHP